MQPAVWVKRWSEFWLQHRFYDLYVRHMIHMLMESHGLMHVPTFPDLHHGSHLCWLGDPWRLMWASLGYRSEIVLQKLPVGDKLTWAWGSHVFHIVNDHMICDIPISHGWQTLALDALTWASFCISWSAFQVTEPALAHHQSHEPEVKAD